jgi:hypothetical protein
MSPQKRRAAARRRAWGRGPIILRFERLEDRQLLTTSTAASQPLPDLVGADFSTAHNLAWGQSFQAVGTILNQGDAATTGPFNVEIFASATTAITSTSVPLGKVTIPAGLGAGQTTSFNQVFSLPPTPIPNYSDGSPIYIDMLVNAGRQLTESNYANDQGVGQGYDNSPVLIQAEQPSLLQGSSLGVTPSATAWGQTITVTAQVRNNAQGDAPATRARLILTPSGLNAGSAYDYTIGYMNVPAIPAWQTVNLSQQITLPPAPPSSLGGNAQFTLSLAEDTDFVTDPIYPHLPTQGAGLDSIPISIAASATSTPTSSSGDTTTPTTPTPTPTPTTLPDLAPSGVSSSSKTLYWGYNFQVSTTIQNLGKADAGPTEVMFLMTGSDGSLANAVFLGETTVPSLAAGTSQQLTQTVNLPSTLPNGVVLSSTGTGRIAVLVDPDHTIDETLRSNDLAESAPVTLRVLGTDGTSTVPTSPAISTSLGQPQKAGTIQSTSTTSTSTSTATAAAAGTTTKTHKAAALKLHRQVTPKTPSLTSKLEHQLKVFPGHVKDFFNEVFGTSSSTSNPKPRKTSK